MHCQKFPHIVFQSASMISSANVPIDLRNNGKSECWEDKEIEEEISNRDTAKSETT